MIPSSPPLPEQRFHRRHRHRRRPPRHWYGRVLQVAFIPLGRRLGMNV